jgi:F-type H+-transporting ATPase subunit delta
MKISRAARQQARRLYRSCLVNGQLDSDRMLAVVRGLVVERPRAFLATLERLKMLVSYEANRRTFTVQSSVELPDQAASVFQSLEQQFGPPLAKHYSVNANLLGGLRVQVGSNVWDGSVRQRLSALNSTIN